MIEVFQAGEYFVEVDNQGCIRNDTTEVINGSNPSIIIKNDTSICIGETFSPGGEPIPGQNYRWLPDVHIDNNLKSNPLLTITEDSIRYTMIVESIDHCLDSSNITIFGLPQPTAIFTYEIDKDSVRFSSDIQQVNNAYLWDFGDGKSSTIQNPVHIYEESGVYLIQLTVENGCGINAAEDSLTIQFAGFDILENKPPLHAYPNPFSEGLNIDNYSQANWKCTIYNAYGQEVNRFDIHATDSNKYLDKNQFGSAGCYMLEFIESIEGKRYSLKVMLL